MAAFLNMYEEPNAYCLCGYPDDGKPMIKCDFCEDWYHISCLNMSLEEYKAFESSSYTWLCKVCEALKLEVNMNAYEQIDQAADRPNDNNTCPESLNARKVGSIPMLKEC